jgi:3-hydroxyisobutyrate dehydrogenase
MQNRQTRVAVLGTGIMGSPIARNLAKAGFAVRAWNRTAAKAQPLAKDGVEVVSSPAEAVTEADVVLTMLTDADAVLSSMTAALPALPKTSVWIQASTVGEGIDDLIAFADKHSIALADAPVQGTRQPAEEGKLLVLCAAEPKVRERLEPVFDVIGSRTFWVDETSSGGTASRLKLATHTYVGALTHAVGEALSMATALNVDSQLFVDAMAGGPLDCAFMQSKAEVIRKGDYPASFTVTNSLKDAHLVLDAAKRHNVELDCTRAGLERYERVAAAGHGEADMAATYLASFIPQSANAFDRHTFDHIGIPTSERHEGEVYVEATKVWLTSPRDHPANVEWLRYEPDTDVPIQVRDCPHVAYRVADIEEAVDGHDVLMDTFEIGDGFAKISFILYEGAVVEFMQYRNPDETGWIK